MTEIRPASRVPPSSIFPEELTYVWQIFPCLSPESLFSTGVRNVRGQQSRCGSRTAPVLGPTAILRSAYHNSSAAQLRHATNRLDAHPCILRLGRYLRLAHRWSWAVQRITFLSSCAVGPTKPPRATASTRKELTGEHPQAGSCQTAKDDGRKPGVSSSHDRNAVNRTSSRSMVRTIRVYVPRHCPCCGG